MTETTELPLYLLERVYLKDRTLGSIYDERGGLICKTLELPWLDNARKISCIKEGTYTVTWSPPVMADNPDTPQDESGGRARRVYEHYIVHNVPGRSGILIHRGSNPTHSQGCILVGGRFADFNSLMPTLEESGVKLQWMVDNLPKKFSLRVIAKSGTPYK